MKYLQDYFFFAEPRAHSARVGVTARQAMIGLSSLDMACMDAWLTPGFRARDSTLAMITA